MAATLERAIKLRFDDPHTARLAVIAADLQGTGAAGYRGLFVRHCQQRGLPITDMIFADE